MCLRGYLTKHCFIGKMLVNTTSSSTFSFLEKENESLCCMQSKNRSTAELSTRNGTWEEVNSPRMSIYFLLCPICCSQFTCVKCANSFEQKLYFCISVLYFCISRLYLCALAEIQRYENLRPRNKIYAKHWLRWFPFLFLECSSCLNSPALQCLPICFYGHTTS